jgi:predicted XRE-type DNA-binding protein
MPITKESPVTKGDVSQKLQSSVPNGGLSSGNVFADLGFEDPETELLKADLVIAIAERIRSLNKTQSEVADLLGVTQPKVSHLLRGHTDDVSIAKLIDHLTKLHVDVTVSLTPLTSNERPARAVVVLRRAKRVSRQLGQAMGHLLGQISPHVHLSRPHAGRSHSTASVHHSGSTRKRVTGAEVKRATVAEHKSTPRPRTTGTRR